MLTALALVARSQMGFPRVAGKMLKLLYHLKAISL